MIPTTATSGRAKEARSTASKRTPYSDSMGHLVDCLTRLDLLLRREASRRVSKSATDYLSFAAITDGEMEHLLSIAPTALRAVPDAEKVEDAIRRLDDDMGERVAATMECGQRLPLVDLTRIFGLSDIEIDAVVACLAPEVDRKYERIYGYLHDDMTRKLPTVGLLLALCTAAPARLAARAATFGPQGRLLRYQILHVGEDHAAQPFAARALKLDDRIVSYLLGSDLVDSRVGDLLAPPRGARAHLSSAQRAARDTITTSITAALKQGMAQRKPLFYVRGDDGTIDDVIREAVAACNLPLLSVDARQLAAGMGGFARGVFVLLRECLLGQAVVHLGRIDQVLEQDPDGLQRGVLVRLLADLAGVAFLSGERPWSWGLPPEPLALLPIELKPTEFAEQIEIWRDLTRGVAHLSDAELREITSKHPMVPSQIAATVQLARAAATLRGEDAIVTADDIKQSCRTRAPGSLSGVARRVEPKYRWDDIVLPDAALDQLRALCSQAKRRSLVLGEWGFERKLSLGKGLNALFAGPPGTGKTMAAEVIARDLDLELYKIDLSQVVSKYIGETEKNLRQIFDQAAQLHAILLFDEADALLGKRSAVKDAHDRYANTEIAYLLQKMEEYEGVTLLTTNLRQNMDDAFIRRLRFVIEFPFPDEAAREGIWRRAWPTATPVAADIDAGFLARRFKLAGGNICNIALSAAFLAAERGEKVHMQLVLESARQELRKMGRLLDESGYGGAAS